MIGVPEWALWMVGFVALIAACGFILFIARSEKAQDDTQRIYQEKDDERTDG